MNLKNNFKKNVNVQRSVDYKIMKKKKIVNENKIYSLILIVEVIKVDLLIDRYTDGRTDKDF